MMIAPLARLHGPTPGGPQVDEGEWQRKGATISDKTACAELGLTRAEVVAAIDAGETRIPGQLDARQPVVQALAPRGRGARPGNAPRQARPRSQSTSRAGARE